MSSDGLKRADQIALLKVVLQLEQTGEWKGIFTYPNCGWDLVQSGLVTEDKKLTVAGKAVLYLLGDDSCDPTSGKSFQEFSVG